MGRRPQVGRSSSSQHLRHTSCTLRCVSGFLAITWVSGCNFVVKAYALYHIIIACDAFAHNASQACMSVIVACLCVSAHAKQRACTHLQ